MVQSRRCLLLKTLSLATSKYIHYHILVTKKCVCRLSSVRDYFESEIGIPIDINKSFLELMRLHYIEELRPTTSYIRMVKEKMSLKKKNKIPKPASMITQLHAYLITYYRALINEINLRIMDKNINLDKVGYVLSMEKLLMEAFYIPSTSRFADIIKESDLIGFTNNLQKILVMDQGEMVASRMVEKSINLDPPSYYVHAHISDNQIHLKLKDIVDTTDSNGGVPESSIVYIKDKLITIYCVYEQVAEVLWDHIQSLDETEREVFLTKHENDISLYPIYKSRLIKFIKEEVIARTLFIYFFY